MKRASVMCDTEPDEIWTLAEYVVNFGDPLHNGKGHERIHHEGSDCVLIPGGKRRKLTGRRAVKAELKEIVDDGSFMLSAGQQVSQMAAMVSNFCPDMFGASLSSNRVSRAETPPAPASSSALEEAVVAAGGASAAPGGFFGMWEVPHEATTASSTNDAETAAHASGVALMCLPLAA